MNNHGPVAYQKCFPQPQKMSEDLWMAQRLRILLLKHSHKKKKKKGKNVISKTQKTYRKTKTTRLYETLQIEAFCEAAKGPDNGLHGLCLQR